MLRRPKRVIVAALADTHAGCKLGLMNPETVLHDQDEAGNLTSYTPRLGGVQRWLWQCYKEDMAQVKALAGRSPVVVIHNGDATHGTKYGEELVSTRPADQIEIAFKNLEPWQSFRLRNMRLITGTPAHGMGEASATLEVSAKLGERARTVNHGLFTIDGTKWDVAHHGAHPGSRNWLKGNIVERYTRSLMYDAVLRYEKPPDVVIRAHYHEWIHRTVRLDGFVTETIILPAYCGLTGHGRQFTRSTPYMHAGLAGIEIVDGEVRKVHPFKRTQDLRTREEL